jgi:hypothetical protein
MATLEEHVTRFRQGLWWTHVTRHGTGNQLLVAYQGEHQLPDRFEHLRAEIADFNNTARQDIGNRVQAIVGLLTLITIPATIIFAVLQILGVKNTAQFIAVLAGVLVLTAGLLLTRPMRTVLGATRRRLYHLLSQD